MHQQKKFSKKQIKYSHDNIRYRRHQNWQEFSFQLTEYESKQNTHSNKKSTQIREEGKK